MARHLMRLTAVLSVLLISACDADREPTGPTRPTVPIVQPVGVISVFLDLERDSPFGLKPYALQIDSTVVLDINPNSSVEANASAGKHLVTLKRPAGELWCVVLEPDTQSVVVTENRRSSLEFHVSCPPVEGSGKFIISVDDFELDYETCGFGGCAVKQRDGSERSTVILQKLTGEIVAEFADVPFGQKNEIVAPAGVYQIRVTPPSNCGVQWTVAAVIHDAETSRWPFGVICD